MAAVGPEGRFVWAARQEGIGRWLQQAFGYWRNVDEDLGLRIEKGVRAGQS